MLQFSMLATTLLGHPHCEKLSDSKTTRSYRADIKILHGKFSGTFVGSCFNYVMIVSSSIEACLNLTEWEWIIVVFIWICYLLAFKW